MSTTAKNISLCLQRRTVVHLRLATGLRLRQKRAKFQPISKPAPSIYAKSCTTVPSIWLCFESARTTQRSRLTRLLFYAIHGRSHDSTSPPSPLECISHIDPPLRIWVLGTDSASPAQAKRHRVKDPIKNYRPDHRDEAHKPTLTSWCEQETGGGTDSATSSACVVPWCNKQMPTQSRQCRLQDTFRGVLFWDYVPD